MLYRAALIFFLCLSSTAHARIYIPVDQPSEKPFPIAVPDLKGGRLGYEIAEVIRNDLRLSGYFKVLPPEASQGHAENEGIALNDIQFGFWAGMEAQALVKGRVESDGGKLKLTLRLFDPYGPSMLVGKQYTVDKKNHRQAAHRFADEIMLALTGIRGVFTTQIAYTAQTGKREKNIFIMDMDGHNSRAVTKYKSLSLSPAWSPDGAHLAFTSYMAGQPDLYLIDTDGKNLRTLVSKKGTCITPTFSPDGKHIAFSSTDTGEAELYVIAPGGKRIHRLTTQPGIDLSPSYSPDGSEIVFATERSGGLHLYKMPSGGGAATRLTFVGYQNDMPSWSPMGDKIVFAGRDLGTFDIFIMNPDGSNIQRLTIGTGSNEHPTFSPDGRFITFSSTRDGESAIFMMRSDGANQTRISKGGGVLPEWGPRTDAPQQ